MLNQCQNLFNLLYLTEFYHFQSKECQTLVYRIVWIPTLYLKSLYHYRIHRNRLTPLHHLCALDS